MQAIISAISDPTPQNVIEALMNTISERTTMRRNHLSQNPEALQSIAALSPSKVPGKLGHATIVAFKVGRLLANHPASKR